MFWVKDKHGATGKVYEVRYEKDSYDNNYTLFLIYMCGAWQWVDSDEYQPL